MLEDLEMYSELDGSELGELCLALSVLYQKYPYFLSKGFKKAIEKEIKAQLDNFKDNSKIVKKEEVYTRVWEELEWN